MRLLRLVPANTKIDFIGPRWWAFGFTILSVVVTVVSLWYQGLNLGIDFTGGVLLEMQKTDSQADIGAMRTTVEGLGFGEVTLQSIGDPSQGTVLIRVQLAESMVGSEQAAAQSIKEALGAGYQIRRQEAVGPKVSGELFQDGVIAVILAVLMIAVYVAFRFEWQFGISAMVATGHDVFVTLGLYSVLQLDFNLTSVAALLTLAGYSINDTVVVFDRIRENRRKFKRMPLPELLNLGVNQTLSRTIGTSLTTALSIIPVALYGGPALETFAAAILFGIAIGTYSSIYVASGLLLYMPPIGHMEGFKADDGGAVARRP